MTRIPCDKCYGAYQLTGVCKRTRMRHAPRVKLMCDRCKNEKWFGKDWVVNAHETKFGPVPHNLKLAGVA